MERDHSTLELFRHDETARAPERDYDVTAFELDTSAIAPQVVPDTTPQVLYDSSFREAYGQTEDSAKERISSHYIAKTALKWPWMVVVLIIAAAIAIGVGVGIWRHREHSANKPSTPAKPSTTISPSVPQNHSTTPAAAQILNDTSLAALILSNGDRQVFFQDNTGRISRAIRSADSEWSTSLYLDLSTRPQDSPNPKNLTPLAVTIDEGPSASYTEVTLYYVTDSHTINSLPVGATEFGLRNCSTAADTRSLSVTLISGQNESSSVNSSINLALLYYETPTGKVSALLQRLTPNRTSFTGQWFNITSQTSQSLPDEFHNPAVFSNSRTLYNDESDTDSLFTPPFASAVNFSKSSTGTTATIGALFYSPHYASIVSDGYQIGQSGYGNFSLDVSNLDTSIDRNSIRRSDVVTFQDNIFMWINGTQPVIGGNQAGTGLPDVPPNSSFPFTRLASATASDLLTTFLYHQIDDKTIAEEQWDHTSGTWFPSEHISYEIIASGSQIYF